MNICNVLQGVFVRVHIKEEELGSRWERERGEVCVPRLSLFLRTLFIFGMESAFCFVFFKVCHHLYLRIYMCLGLTPNLSARLTQSAGGTLSRCATVSFTRDY